MTAGEMIELQEDEMMDESQLMEYVELVEALGTRAVRQASSFMNLIPHPSYRSPCSVWKMFSDCCHFFLLNSHDCYLGKAYCQLTVNNC